MEEMYSWKPNFESSVNPPTTYPTTHRPPINRLTEPTIADRTTRLCLKDSTIWRHSFYRMQTQLQKWKVILQFIIFLNKINVFQRMNNIYLYCSANFCKTRCFSFLHVVRIYVTEYTFRAKTSDVRIKSIQEKIAFLSTQLCKKICYISLGTWKNWS